MKKTDTEPSFDLIRLLRDGHGRIECESLLTAILTPKELKEIQKRLDVLAMLTNTNFTQRQIAKHLKTGIATVTRGSEVVKDLESKNPSWWKDFKSW